MNWVRAAALVSDYGSKVCTHENKPADKSPWEACHIQLKIEKLKQKHTNLDPLGSFIRNFFLSEWTWAIIQIISGSLSWPWYVGLSLSFGKTRVKASGLVRSTMANTTNVATLQVVRKKQESVRESNKVKTEAIQKLTEP